MAADSKHLYLVAKGSYTASELSAETWQCGVRLWADTSVPEMEGLLPTTGDFEAASNSSAPTGLHITSNWEWNQIGGSVIDPLLYLEEQAAPAWDAYLGEDTISQFVRLDELRLYPILGDGKAFDGRVAVCSYDTKPLGGRTGTQMPTEVSLVVSHRTLRPGPRGRGRMYLPPSSATGIATSGFVSSTLITNELADHVTFLEALSVDSVTPGAPHVRPAIIGAPWDRYAVISSIDIGNVWDSQRRRRRSLTEGRSSASVSY